MLDRREDVEHARFRALAQLIMGIGAESHEEGIKAFEDYMKVAFPGLETKRRKKESQIKKQLEWWVNRGPVSFTPQPGFNRKQGKSRMVRRIQNVDTGRLDQVYKKLGKHV